MRILWCRALVGLLVLGACSDGGDAEDAAPPTQSSADPPTTSPSTSTTTAPPADPFAVPADPADIDEAYVERVVNELYRVADAAVAAQQQGADVEDLFATLQGVYHPDVVNGVLTDELAFAAEGYPGLKPDAGSAAVSIASVRVADATCILAEGTQDVSAVVENAPPPFEGVLELRRRTMPEANAEGSVNATPWLIVQFASPETYDGIDTCEF